MRIRTAFLLRCAVVGLSLLSFSPLRARLRRRLLRQRRPRHRSTRSPTPAHRPPFTLLLTRRSCSSMQSTSLRLPFHWSGNQWLLFSGYVGSVVALSRADQDLSARARSSGRTLGFVGDTLEGLGDGRSFVLLGASISRVPSGTTRRRRTSRSTDSQPASSPQGSSLPCCRRWSAASARPKSAEPTRSASSTAGPFPRAT